MKKYLWFLLSAMMIFTPASSQNVGRRITNSTSTAPRRGAIGGTSIKATPMATTSSGGNAYASLTTAWSYAPNAPACPASGTLTNCIEGFNVTISEGTTVVLTATAGYATGQLGPTATSVVWTPTGGVPFASYSTTVTAVGYDLNGTQIQSTPVSSTLVVGLTTLNAPTNVTLTAN